jgi:predicted nuclease of predicted toxin-antitoxin system
MRLASDENFNGEIVRGLFRRFPDIDLVRAQDVGLMGEDDPTVLEWAASQGRILLTHDRATIPDFAYERLANGLPMPGVFVIGNRFPVGQAIEEILLVLSCSTAEDWDAVVCHLPL